jgi:oligopeptide/dipeptide ABC transporter ATP-binding protein
MRIIRGAQISMIFQEPMTSLNPVLTVGFQLSEVIRSHLKVDTKQAWMMGTKAFESVGIADAAERMKSYPFEMSGGMRQRVMIAKAISCRPKLIIADEPTTALDVTTQAQVMELLLSVVHKIKTSLLIVTHNLGLVTRYAKRIYVMYAGKIIESGTAEDILTHPRHPYTVGLLKSVPRLDEKKGRKLVPIKGAPPNLVNLPSTCAFLPRCDCAHEICTREPSPELRLVGDNEHYAACYLESMDERK